MNPVYYSFATSSKFNCSISRLIFLPHFAPFSSNLISQFLHHEMPGSCLQQDLKWISSSFHVKFQIFVHYFKVYRICKLVCPLFITHLLSAYTVLLFLASFSQFPRSSVLGRIFIYSPFSQNTLRNINNLNRNIT